MDNEVISRREILRAGGVTTAATLAGCSGGGNGTGGGTVEGGTDTADGGTPGNGGGDDGGGAGPEETAFTPSECTPETAPSSITADTTWSPEECPRVALEGNVRVSDGATLTVEPGVEVVARAGARLTVQAGSALEARGEPTNPVWFYGGSDATGFWEGIRFRSQANNVLDNVVVRNGGQNAWANIYVDGNAQATVTNTLSERCSTAGLVAESGTTLTEFSSNAFRGNGGAAAAVPTTHVGMLDSGSVYAGDNGNDVIQVFSDGVESDATWPATDAPFRFAGSNHQVGAAVTVDPGAKFRFQEGARITVSRGGALIAEGSESDPITFEGATDTSGFWEGIRIRTNNPNNSFDSVEVANGGQNAWANIYLDGNAQAAVTNTLSRQSATSGLIAGSGTTLRDFSSNSFQNNEFAALEIPTTHVGMLDSGSVYAGDNGNDVIQVFSDGVESDATWPATDAPFRFAGSNHQVGAAVTVDPGAKFRFQEGARITVSRGGALTAEGSESDPITFEGATDTGGFWEGIRIRTNNPNNSFQHVEVANGGQNAWANIYLDGNAQATVTNSTLRRSATWGIVVTADATLDASNNVYQNNAEGAIKDEGTLESVGSA